MVIRNKPRPVTAPNIGDMNHVVYQYNCNIGDCKSTYIGYTTRSVSDRMGGHTQKGSIIDHIRGVHHRTGTVKRKELVSNIKILKKCNKFGHLRLYEALMIKQLEPDLNTKDESSGDLLKVFIH